MLLFLQPGARWTDRIGPFPGLLGPGRNGANGAPARLVAVNRGQDLRDRSFRFACDVGQFAIRSAVVRSGHRILDQLLRAATSVGANLEEAQAASSRREFVRFVEIALREAREVHYWLRLCIELNLGSKEELERLRGEAGQIARITAAIVISTKRRMAAGDAVFAFCILNFALLFS